MQEFVSRSDLSGAVVNVETLPAIVAYLSPRRVARISLQLRARLANRRNILACGCFFAKAIQ